MTKTQATIPSSNAPTATPPTSGKKWPRPLHKRSMLLMELIAWEIKSFLQVASEACYGSDKLCGECLTRITNQWSQVASMPSVARQGVCSATLNGKFYVFGGSDGTNSLKSVEIYDPEAGPMDRRS